MYVPVVWEHPPRGVPHDSPADGSKQAKLEVCYETDGTTEDGGDGDGTENGDDIDLRLIIIVIIVDVWASFYFIISWVFVFYLLFRVFVAHCKVWVPVVLTYCVQHSLRIDSSQLLLGRKREYTHKWEYQAINDYTVVAHLRCNYKKCNIKMVRFVCAKVGAPNILDF